MDAPPRRLAIGLPQQQVPMIGSSGGLNGQLIVHQDIKPSNGDLHFQSKSVEQSTDMDQSVFLGTPFNSHFQVYPQAKVSYIKSLDRRGWI